MNKFIVLVLLTLTSISFAEKSKLNEVEFDNANKEINLLLYGCIKRAHTQFEALNKWADSTLIMNRDGAIFRDAGIAELFKKAYDDLEECKEKLTADFTIIHETYKLNENKQS